MKNNLFLIATLMFIAGCGKSSNMTNNNQTTTPPSPPVAAIQVAPNNNQVCYPGTILSDSISVVSFSWGPAKHANNYTVFWTNLLTGVASNQTVNDTHLDVQLERNTPFSWSVQSNSSLTKVTASSPVWRFYNSGNGITSYAPFPAILVAPVFAAALPSTSQTVTLQWSGSTVSAGSTLTYDVYFGTTNAPPLNTAGLSIDSLSQVGLSSGTTYYWKVITKDELGNSSISQVSQFSDN